MVLCVYAFAEGSVFDYAQNSLQTRGVLKESNGFIYVDIPDEFVHQVVHFLEEDGFEEPPYFERGDIRITALKGIDLVGAHISVAFPGELSKYKIDRFEECGKTIDFTLKHCSIIPLPSHPDLEEAYFLIVEAPILDEIRRKYGLAEKRYEYHITLGVKFKPVERCAG